MQLHYRVISKLSLLLPTFYTMSDNPRGAGPTIYMPPHEGFAGRLKGQQRELRRGTAEIKLACVYMYQRAEMLTTQLQSPFLPIPWDLDDISGKKTWGKSIPDILLHVQAEEPHDNQMYSRNRRSNPSPICFSIIRIFEYSQVLQLPLHGCS